MGGPMILYLTLICLNSSILINGLNFQPNLEYIRNNHVIHFITAFIEKNKHTNVKALVRALTDMVA